MALPRLKPPSHFTIATAPTFGDFFVKLKRGTEELHKRHKTYNKMNQICLGVTIEQRNTKKKMESEAFLVLSVVRSALEHWEKPNWDPNGQNFFFLFVPKRLLKSILPFFLL